MPVDWDGAPPGFQGLIRGKGRIPKEKLLFPEGEGTGKQLILNSLPFPPTKENNFLYEFRSNERQELAASH